MSQNNYFNERNILIYNRFEKIVDNELPYFCNDFFNGIDTQTTYLTKLNYAMDIAIFFYFLKTKHAYFKSKDTSTLNVEDLNEVTSTDIEYFLRFLSFYKYKDKFRRNGDRSKARKLSSVRSLLDYFYKNNRINENVASKVKNPKIRTKNIVKLDVDEVNELLDSIENENVFDSNFQNAYNKNTQLRDYTIIAFMLNTGIRISECVSLNINDINLKDNSFVVTRKGGNQSKLYFSDEFRNDLETYLVYRYDIVGSKDIAEKDRDALFISLQNKRLSVRAIQNIVKKFTQATIFNKNISPHKLRSTFGTSLYNATNDIYVVAEVLGHKDVNTTKTYYASMSDKIKKDAANKKIYKTDINKD